jgi:hypothetical protein
MLAEANVCAVDILAEAGTHPLNSPDDWWKIAMGSGYRGTLEQLDTDALDRVRQGNLSRLVEKQVNVIETNVIYAVATKEDKYALIGVEAQGNENAY